MKSTLYITLILLTGLFITSCNSSKVVSGGFLQARKYNKGVHLNLKKSPLPSIVKNTSQGIEQSTSKLSEPILNEKEIEILQQKEEQITPPDDSVKVILYNGKSFEGVITKEEKTGIFLKTASDRVIYLSRYEIKEIVIDEGDTENDYYVKNHSKRKDTKIETNTVPKSTKWAEGLGIATLSTLYFGISMMFLIPGLILSIIGYRKAAAFPEIFDVKRAERIKKTYVITSIILGVVMVTLAILIIILFI